MLGTIRETYGDRRFWHDVQRYVGGGNESKDFHVSLRLLDLRKSSQSRLGIIKQN